MNKTLIFFLIMYGVFTVIETVSIILYDMSSGVLLPILIASIVGYFLIKRREKKLEEEKKQAV